MTILGNLRLRNPLLLWAKSTVTDFNKDTVISEVGRTIHLCGPKQLGQTSTNQINIYVLEISGLYAVPDCLIYMFFVLVLLYYLYLYAYGTFLVIRVSLK